MKPIEMLRINVLIITFILGMISFPACTKVDRVNPYDDKANLSPYEWAPQNLTIEDISITKKKLSWTYDDKNIEGFKIERRVNNSAWLSPFPNITKDLRSFVDTSVQPDSSLKYGYRIFAIAGINQSSNLIVFSNACFTAPSNLTLIIDSESSATLNWEDNSIGEEGFYIERSLDAVNWEVIATLTSAFRSYQDSSFPAAKNVYYRISAFYNDYKTAFSETFVKRTPDLTTASITSIRQSSATSGGNITYSGGLPITSRGVCWSTSPNPDLTDLFTSNGVGIGSFTSIITGLTLNTKYFVRAYATNITGTVYGDEISFDSPSIIDVDGNAYTTTTIGNQIWLAENLRVVHFRNGEPISNLSDNTQWSSTGSSAYCWYNNDELAYKDTYGALYNYYAVVDTRNLCPTGWHIPSDVDWLNLIYSLGGEDEAGAKMKSTIGWSSNGNGTNISGFSGLPGGNRTLNGIYLKKTYFGYWWSSTENNTTTSLVRCLGYNTGSVVKNSLSKNEGCSIRCLKD